MKRDCVPFRARQARLQCAGLTHNYTQMIFKIWGRFPSYYTKRSLAFKNRTLVVKYGRPHCVQNIGLYCKTNRIRKNNMNLRQGRPYRFIRSEQGCAGHELMRKTCTGPWSAQHFLETHYFSILPKAILLRCAVCKTYLSIAQIQHFVVKHCITTHRPHTVCKTASSTVKQIVWETIVLLLTSLFWKPSIHWQSCRPDCLLFRMNRLVFARRRPTRLAASKCSSRAPRRPMSRRYPRNELTLRYENGDPETVLLCVCYSWSLF